MGNTQSKIEDNKDDGFVIIDDYEIDRHPETFLTNVVNHSKTAISLASIGLTVTARLIGTALGGLGKLTVLASRVVSDSLVVNQEFKTDCYETIMRFEKITFFIIEGPILGFRNGDRVCRFAFNLDISKIEMFRLTDDIGFFLFHTRDGNTVATVFTNQHSGHELILTKITDDECQFERFEVSEFCMFGTVSLTVFYKNGTEKYFRIERNGIFKEVFLP